ncbi:MAG: extracellular solute-binding protein, partial [Acholeplasmataceae bacterium]
LLDSATYEIAFYNSSRDAYMQAMFATGTNDINNPTTAEFDAATAWLNNGLTADTYVITDDIFEAMAKPSIYDLAVSYSGDANYLMMENDDLDFFVPEEGTNVWVDGFVIPKGAQTDYAYEFISFMLSYDAAKQNSEWVGYTSPRQDVLTDLLNGDFASYASSYDVRINSNDSVYRYDEDLKVQIDNSWQEILANKGFDEEGVGSGTLVAVILVVVVVVGSGAVSFFRKKRKLA